ncbi:SprT-like domain-containing protein [Amnibacterium sp. CER49]|uniref:SprT-like domain-containing protein n=1 Tax=Amnibacterium sp. CER49 TaxID=3039161 RepID=UPI00244B9712|nr:SprT-like domain-containing protein [Amnibacterium sp. CER49]MDH2443835.1 SprT-like domain-containing protein [Amnibacterium sp. CER49]
MVDAAVVTDIAEGLLAAHLGGGGWSFGFDNARRRAGACDYARRRITVSRYLVAKASEDEVRQVLLHEVAHALAGHAAAHGARWKTAARRIGYTGARLHPGSIADETAPWVGTCPSGHVHYRFRRPTAPLSCGLCGTRFSAATLIEWRPRPAQAHAAPAARALIGSGSSR